MLGENTPSGGFWKVKVRDCWNYGQKKPALLTAKQCAARLKFAKQYKNLTTEEWDDFPFLDKCPKYLFQLPNLKNDTVPPAYQVKKAQNGSYGVEWQAMVSMGYIF